MCGREATVSDLLSDGALATEVRARRIPLKLRQEELADLAGVSERFVYALEKGRRRPSSTRCSRRSTRSGCIWRSTAEPTAGSDDDADR
jgi:Helix-turn-helix